LNSDTVVEERWLSELVKMLNTDETIGAVVSKIYLATKTPTIDCVGAEFNNLGFVWGRGTNEPDRGQFETVMEVPSLTACAALIRRSAIGTEPLFDSRLYMYYEEFDLALRLRGRGHSIVYVPTSLVHHKRSQSVQKLSQPRLFHQFYSNRNRIKLLAKYYPLAVLLPALPLILLSLIYCDWLFLRQGELRLFIRAVVSQVHYAGQGLLERFRGGSVDTRRWVPWMTKQGLREVLALRSKLGTYVQ
jgi:GT2 family glycosyltransferase